MANSAKNNPVNFENPPVVETALSVQFEKLSAMRSVHFGLFWQQVKDQYPKTQDRPALASVIEQDKEPAPSFMKLRFEAQEALSPQRLWLLNDIETEMMQIQNDRFIKNWRKNDKNQEYPRYSEVIKPAFEQDFKIFQKFIKDEELGAIKINQCELTYVNHIIAGKGWDDWNEIEKVFTFWNPPIGSPYPGRAADCMLHTRFPILHNGNQWIGWLHLDIQPAVNVSDGKPMYAVTLTARGMFGKEYDFFDIGREWIVKSFEQLTTKNMHKVWVKK